MYSKKIIVSAILFAFTTHLAFAGKYKDEEESPPPPALKDGFYFGVQAGYDSFNVDVKDNIGAATASATMSPIGWTGGFLLGYGWDFNMFYVGTEAFVNYATAEATSRFNNASAGISAVRKLGVNTGYGLAILPGFKFTPSTLSYVRLGFNWSQQEVTESFSSVPETYTAKGNFTASGFVFGVGMETLLPIVSNHLSLRGEYTYTNYSSYTPRGGQTNFNPLDNQFMVSLIFHV